VEFISKYSKFWEKIANSDGTCNSAYGYQLWGIKNEFGYTEWQWALGSLLNDKDTRQAIVRFNKPMHSFDGNRDFVCTLNGVFQIRDDKLNLFISMRSSDAIKGLTFDFPFFSLLQQMMRLQLLNEYPDLEIGSLDMVLNSSHIYESDFELVSNMLDAADIDYFEADALPVANADLIGMSVEDILSANDPLSKWIQENA
jgi:thymidylate synthase